MTKVKGLNPIYTMQPSKTVRRAFADRTFDPKNLVRNVGLPVGIAISGISVSGCLKDTIQPAVASQPIQQIPTELVQPANDYDQGRRFALDNANVNACWDRAADPATCIQGYNDQLRTTAPAIPSTIPAQQTQDFNPYVISRSQPALTENTQPVVTEGSRLERWKDRASTAAVIARDLYRDARTYLSTTESTQQAPSIPMMQADLGYNDPASALNQGDTLGNFTVTQAINRDHAGTDIAYSQQNGQWPDTTGAPIHTLPGAPSEVTCSYDSMGGIGIVAYQPGSDIAFNYIHLDSCFGQNGISPGDPPLTMTVDPGIQIGTIGNTGSLSNGPHLHVQPSRITPGETVDLMTVSDTERLLPLTRQTAEYILGANPQ